MVCVRRDDNVSHALELEQGKDFDQFPVLHDDSIVGILFRGDYDRSWSVADVMNDAGDGVLVSSTMPIADLIPELQILHAKLILRNARIEGLVTQSDLLKLPVRILVFGLVNHLELCLRALIRTRLKESEWLDRLNSAARSRVTKDQRRLRKQRLEPDPLEFTTFSHLIQIVLAEPDMPDDSKEELERIKALRDDIAHAKTFIASPDDVYKFATTFIILQRWIENITLMVEAAS
ncbi:MAG: hypothetical protein IPK87_00770 [Planctomycetes bacterium]|nr:hypothetical protein [Planctomycetota bacterium]